MRVEFKRLAKDTTIYGVSSILARALSFLLLPVYTRVLDESNFGICSEILAYIAFIQVILIFGLETGFFRFVSLKEYDSDKVFSTISIFLTVVSLSFFLLIFAFSGNIAANAGYNSLSVIYAAGILAIDAFTSVFFAQLRYRRKALKFAIFRSIKIIAEVIFNLLFLFVLPAYFASHPQSVLLSFFTPEASYVYILAAILCSCIVSVILFIPEIFKVKYTFSASYLKVLLIYSLPLMLAGLQGILNDFIDRPLFRYLAPENDFTWEEQLGVFSASAKLAVIMSLFVQMFRYAAEPYFFAESSKTDIKPVYAKITKYFTIFCIVIFLLISYYSNILQYLLGKDFRSGMIVLPIMLFAYMLSGINQNISIWYKLASKTKVAIVVTSAGLITTIAVNYLFMPTYGYMATAWGHVASYTVMITLSWQLSKRYYKIPYQWKSILLYIVAGLILFFTAKLIETPAVALNLVFNTVLLLVFIYFILKKEKIPIKNAKKILSRKTVVNKSPRI
ncbi:MAG: oligosaccharide flippase family protein [Prevotellaceae bacterium]|jgi:O-antigen/teichoic acid export membrane protein|nr:oligosaccharide flippase family protein [Prevotellaceae bacterium]